MYSIIIIICFIGGEYMKKNIITIAAALIVACTAFSLTACSGGDNNSPAAADTTSAAETQADADTGALSDADYVFSFNGVDVELDGDADAAVKALGEAKDVSSQLTCHAQEGDDKTYTYDGFVLNTYPKDGKDAVLEVIVSKKGIPTSKGVEIGDDVSKVTDAYGDKYAEIGLYYAYDADNGKSLRFLIEDNKVAEIDYYYNV